VSDAKLEKLCEVFPEGKKVAIRAKLEWLLYTGKKSANLNKPKPKGQKMPAQNYCIMRFRKLKTNTEITQAFMHNVRLTTHGNINQEKSKHNHISTN
jgi:hypothetical protein